MQLIKRRFVILTILVLIGFLIGLFYYARYDFVVRDLRPERIYVVQSGDTCTKIALKFGVSVFSFAKANHLKIDCSDLYAGRKLLIPYPTSTLYSSATPLGFVSLTPVSIIDFERVKYTVKQGDTLESISQDYAVEPGDLAAYNGLGKDAPLVPGSLLIILLYHPHATLDPTAVFTPKPVLLTP